MTHPVPNLEVGDRVRIRNNRSPKALDKIFDIVEVDVKDGGWPAAPSKYLVRMKRAGSAIDHFYGDAALVKVDD